MDVDDDLRDDGHNGLHRTGVAHSYYGSPGSRQRTDWRRIHYGRIDNRLPVGTSDVGNLLGMGCTPDIGTGIAVSLFWRHCTVQRIRGTAKSSKGCLAYVHRWRNQLADYLFLG